MLNHRLAGCYRYLIALSLSLATFFPLTAEALYQYEYTGNQIYGGYHVYETDETLSLIGNITVSFTSANLLTGDESFDDISNFVMNFNSNIVNAELTWPPESHPTSNYGRIFTIHGVHEDGTPIAWSMGLWRDDPAPENELISTHITTGNYLDDAGGGDSFTAAWGAQGYNNPGTWSVTSPVPEPETYAMMLAGLGMIGFVSRRKKQY